MDARGLDISGYIVAKFDADYRNENWRFDCPFCGADRQRFSVSIEKNVVHCWKCSYTNSLIGFVKDHEAVSIGQAFRIVLSYTPIRTSKPKRTKPKVSRVITKVPGYIKLRPKKLRSSKTPMIYKMALAYLRKRGLSDDDIEYWRLGISNSEGYSGRIIVPIYERSNLIYFVGRKFTGPGPKYLNPPAEWGIGAEHVIFNGDALENYRDISIVEGVFDAMSVGRGAIALLTKHANDYKISRIIQANPSMVNIMLDSDAQDEALNLAGILGELFPTKITIYKNGDPAENQAAAPNSKEEVNYSLREIVRRRLDHKE